MKSNRGCREVLGYQLWTSDGISRGIRQLTLRVARYGEKDAVAELAQAISSGSEQYHRDRIRRMHECWEKHGCPGDRPTRYLDRGFDDGEVEIHWQSNTDREPHETFEWYAPHVEFKPNDHALKLFQRLYRAIPSWNTYTAPVELAEALRVKFKAVPVEYVGSFLWLSVPLDLVKERVISPPAAAQIVEVAA